MDKIMCLVLVFLWKSELSSQYFTDSKTTSMQMMRNEGYPAEEHVARTADGYRLRVHRIPPARARPPVLLVHGMLGRSDDFLIMGRGRSIGYLLADAGYDVFLGNLRFNVYASHENKSKSDPTYWDFGIDEHGQLDVPAMMELVMRVSGARAMHYVGYSMGTTSYIIMCASRPDLAARVLSFVALAPAVHMTNLRPLADLVVKFNLPEMFKSQGISHLTLGRYQHSIATNLCNPRVPSEDVCFTLAFFFIGDDYDQVEWKMVSTVIAKLQPATLKQLLHYLQLIQTDTLRRFDYGAEENMKRYGSKVPPSYDLRANKAPVALFYGNNDRLTSADEMNQMAEVYRKTNTLLFIRRVPWRKFNHYDFIFAKDLPTLVNNDIVRLIDNITEKENNKNHFVKKLANRIRQKEKNNQNTNANGLIEPTRNISNFMNNLSNRTDNYFNNKTNIEENILIK